LETRDACAAPLRDILAFNVIEQFHLVFDLVFESPVVEGIEDYFALRSEFVGEVGARLFATETLHEDFLVGEWYDVLKAVRATHLLEDVNVCVT